MMQRRGLQRSDVRFLCLFAFIVVLVVFGAAVFQVLEDPWEADIRHRLRAHLNRFKEENACVSGRLLRFKRFGDDVIFFFFF